MRQNLTREGLLRAEQRLSRLERGPVVCAAKPS
jgi:hypothetical protein